MGNNIKKFPGKMSSVCFYGDICIGGSDLRNLSRVRDYLYLGSCRCADNWDHLEEEGITHIINTADGMLKRYARNWELRPGIFKYFLIDLQDKKNQSIFQWFDPCYEWIEKARREGEETKGRATRILVHCVQGKSRSVAITIAYLMRKEGISVMKALNQIRAVRDVVHTPNKGFMKQLYKYEKKLGIKSDPEDDFPLNSVKTKDLDTMVSDAEELRQNSKEPNSRAQLMGKSAISRRTSLTLGGLGQSDGLGSNSTKRGVTPLLASANGQGHIAFTASAASINATGSTKSKSGLSESKSSHTPALASPLDTEKQKKGGSPPERTSRTSSQASTPRATAGDHFHYHPPPRAELSPKDDAAAIRLSFSPQGNKNKTTKKKKTRL